MRKLNDIKKSKYYDLIKSNEKLYEIPSKKIT